MMKSLTVLVVALLLASSCDASDSKSKHSKDSKKSSAAKLNKSSDKKKAAFTAQDEFSVKKVEEKPKGSSAIKEKFVFDPMHLHFGNNKNMKKLKQSLYMADGTNPLKDVAKAPTAKKSDAAPAASSSKPAENKSLRSSDERRRLSASLWESLFGAPTATSVEDLEEAKQEEGVQSDNSTVPELPDQIVPPPKKVTETEIKPKKRATKYFESRFYGGDGECSIKHNTFFTSHTFGVEACFPSSLSTEDLPVYTASFVTKVLDQEEDMRESYQTLTKFYYDEACEIEFDHKGYYPISDTLSQSCEEKENLEASADDDGAFDTVSKDATLWELSHAPHRETAGHQMSITIYARGRDCLKGQADEAGKMMSLQERLTFSHASDTCMENDDGQSYFMKCMPEEKISIHGFDNANCAGEPKGVAELTREELCNAEWSGVYTTGSPVVQCGIGENWNDHVDSESSEDTPAASKK